MITREKIEFENIINFDIEIKKKKINILLLIEKIKENTTTYIIKLFNFTKNLKLIDEIILNEKPLFIEFKKKIGKIKEIIFTVILENKLLRIYKIFENKKIVF